ncbi:Flavodoxin [Bosea sp. OK403]|uniref:flavodoxin n=1 Tax=Bosea sp. OK403 TaxID=1855286 RepID=UPI0008F0E421|nr:flavodoxin [Bosea sp. OK403]SFJ70873.1 Flavodoxin [Bosea sp. OK403]
MTTSFGMTGPSRKAILAAPLILPAVAGGASSRSAVARQGAATDVLVAYHSRTGNTCVIAGQIRRARNADFVEICTAARYPEDYEQTVEQARLETEAGFEPPLVTDALDMARYRTVSLGFPIWGQEAPPAVRSFVKAYDWAGKTIRPFVTHGGYGLGTSTAVLAVHTRGARRAPPFAIEAEQERRTLSCVTDWLGAA